MANPGPAPNLATGVPQTVEEVLLGRGIISQTSVDQAKLEAASTKRPTFEIILEKGWASEEDVYKARALILGVGYVSLVEKAVSPEVLSLIPQEVARRYNLIPYARDQSKLYVAMEDPSDLSVMEFLQKKTGLEIVPSLTSPTELSKAFSEKYAQALTTEVTAALKETVAMPTPEVLVPEAQQITGEAPIAKIVSTLIEYAIKVRATDIHIEPMETDTRVRFRIDGILHEKLLLPKKIHDAVISRIKIMSDMKIDEKRVPQDARFDFKVGSAALDLRVSTLPTIFGEKVELRLLPKSGGVPTLPELGLRGTGLRNLEISILRPHGIILICGPTGSGKTTTLYSILSRLNAKAVNIVALEDPVEYQISGVNQVQINPAAGLTFANGLRSILRQDPNIIMVGEIRDFETTELAIQASLTGHLVFSTLHTNNASGAVPRLIDMGAEPFLIASSITCVVGQRVLRRLCPHCRELFEPPPEVVENLKKVLGNLFPKDPGVQSLPKEPRIEENQELPKSNEQSSSPSQNLEPSEGRGLIPRGLKIYRAGNCNECVNSGYLGRIGIFEVLPLSEKIAKLTLERVPALEIEKQAQEEGMITMKQDGYLKVIEGITTIEEVLRVAEE